MADLFAPPRVGHPASGPRSLADILDVEAIVRVPTSDLLSAMVEIRDGARSEYDGVSMRTCGAELALRTPVDPLIRRDVIHLRLPCTGRFQDRLAFLVRDFAALCEAPFYDRHTDLILCANEPSLYVGKYWLPVRIEEDAVRRRRPSGDELELLARIAAIDAENGLAPPLDVEALAVRYERDHTLTTLLKRLRGGACQVCGSSFVTKAGGSYTECHHLEQLANGGLDVSRNMLVLCANHHRQFHYGRVEVISHSSELLVVSIDSEIYRCSLAADDWTRPSLAPGR
jgi:hypothetical protein